MSDSRSRQSLAVLRQRRAGRVRASHCVAARPALPPTKSIACEMSSALRVFVPRRSIAATKSETPSVSRLLVVAARLHGDAEADDGQLLARDDDDLQSVLEREALDRRQRQLRGLGRRGRADEIRAPGPEVGVRVGLGRGAGGSRTGPRRSPGRRAAWAGSPAPTRNPTTDSSTDAAQRGSFISCLPPGPVPRPEPGAGPAPAAPASPASGSRRSGTSSPPAARRRR